MLACARVEGRNASVLVAAMMKERPVHGHYVPGTAVKVTVTLNGEESSLESSGPWTVRTICSEECALDKSSQLKLLAEMNPGRQLPLDGMNPTPRPPETSSSSANWLAPGALPARRRLSLSFSHSGVPATAKGTHNDHPVPPSAALALLADPSTRVVPPLSETLMAGDSHWPSGKPSVPVVDEPPAQLPNVLVVGLTVIDMTEIGTEPVKLTVFAVVVAVSG